MWEVSRVLSDQFVVRSWASGCGSAEARDPRSSQTLPASASLILPPSYISNSIPLASFTFSPSAKRKFTQFSLGRCWKRFVADLVTYYDITVYLLLHKGTMEKGCQGEASFTWKEDLKVHSLLSTALRIIRLHNLRFPLKIVRTKRHFLKRRGTKKTTLEGFLFNLNHYGLLGNK